MTVAQGIDALRWWDPTNVEVPSYLAVGAADGTEPTFIGAANGIGIGKVQIVDGGAALRYRAPTSDLFGPRVPIPVDGEYLLRDGKDPNAWVRVLVYRDYLPTSGQSDVFVTELWNNATAGPDVDESDAASGVVDVLEVRLANVSSMVCANVVVWIDPAVADVAIGTSPFGPWFTPTDEDSGLQVAPSLQPGALAQVFVQRTTAPASPANPALLVQLHAAFTTI